MFLSPKYIDQTNLKVTFSESEMINFLETVKSLGFASVCIPPSFVTLAVKYLQGTNTKVCTVIGFPLGFNTTESKIFEAIDAIKNGASEIDMVWNINMAKSGQYNYLVNEIKKIKKAITKENVSSILKVIVETCLLTQEEKLMACKAIKEAGADFIKTSTGFQTAGATVDDVTMFVNEMKDTEIQVKASGGISTLEDAKLFVKIGATRLGSSAGLKLIDAKIKANVDEYNY